MKKFTYLLLIISIVITNLFFAFPVNSITAATTISDCDLNPDGITLNIGASEDVHMTLQNNHPASDIGTKLPAAGSVWDIWAENAVSPGRFPIGEIVTTYNSRDLSNGSASFSDVMALTINSNLFPYTGKFNIMATTKDENFFCSMKADNWQIEGGTTTALILANVNCDINTDQSCIKFSVTTNNWFYIFDKTTANLQPSTEYKIYACENNCVSGRPLNGFPTVCVSFATGNLRVDFTKSPPCETGSLYPGRNPCTTGPNGECITGLGRIPANFGAFASRLLAIALGVGGGLALILMVFGAVRVMTSSGNPQNANQGREIMIAAVAGLLFIAFAVLILQFIGVVIVPIPGLTFGIPT